MMSNDTQNIHELVKLSPPSLIKQLREAAKPPGKKGSWIKHLSDAQRLEVYYRGKKGQPAYGIVRIAQRDWNVMPKSSAKSLSRSMSTFLRNTVGTIQYDGFDTKENKDVIDKTTRNAKGIEGKFDLMKQFRNHINDLTARVDMWKEKEGTMKIPMKGTEESYKILLKYLEKYFEFAAKLGALDVKPSELNLNIKGGFAHVMGMVHDTDNMTDFLSRFLEQANKKSSKLTFDDETGEMKLLKPGGEIIDVTPTKRDDDDSEGD